MFLLMTSVGWGLNWPIMKYLLSQWPPLSARGLTGVVGALALALYAVVMGISLKVPRDQWFRLVVSAILNVSLWMAVMGYALVWLPASEAAVIAYTMPIWTALFAWPLLGEQIAVAIANRNACEYCLAAHTALGRKAGASIEQMAAAQIGQSSDPATSAALDFALKVVEERAQIADGDVQALRAAGFDDEQIVEILAHVALNLFTNYVNVAFDVPVDFPKVALR